MPALTVDLAGPEDDAALRRMLRETVMPGAVSLSFEREPCYFRAAAIEGPLHQTLAMREAGTGALVGMGSRSVRPMYVNGREQNVGYISQLRASPDYRFGLAMARMVARGFAYHRALHADGRAPYYLCSIVEGNEPARRLLASGLPGLPRFREHCRLMTYAVNIGRRRRVPTLPGRLRLERGSQGCLDAILDCLARTGRRRQFAPLWTRESLFSPEATPDLRPEDFWLVVDGERVVACLALWDQSGIKQTVVRGYGGLLARRGVRRLANVAATVGGWPVLPPVDAQLNYCYASHLAVDGDDPRVFAALLAAVHNAALARGCSYFMLGLSEANPLRPVLTRAYRHIAYPSRLYLVAWDDGLEAIEQVDGRVPAPEVAVL